MSLRTWDLKFATACLQLGVLGIGIRVLLGRCSRLACFDLDGRIWKSVDSVLRNLSISLESVTHDKRIKKALVKEC